MAQDGINLDSNWDAILDAVGEEDGGGPSGGRADPDDAPTAMENTLAALTAAYLARNPLHRGAAIRGGAREAREGPRPGTLVAAGPILDTPNSPATTSSSIGDTSSSYSISVNYDDYTDYAVSMGDLDSYVVPDRAYYHEMEKVLKAKADDIMTYFRTKNHKIQYLDWPAGNPDDPDMVKKLATDAADPKNSMDTANREKIARMVARITFEVEGEIDPKSQFGKTMFFGDWLASGRGEKDCFIEIQVKRIQGCDPVLLDECGISCQIVFLPIADLHKDDNGVVTIKDAEERVAAKYARETADIDAEAEFFRQKQLEIRDNVSSGSSSATGNPPGIVGAFPIAPAGSSSSPSQAHRVPGMAAQASYNPFRHHQRSASEVATIRLAHRRELRKRYDALENLVPNTRDWGMRAKESFVYLVKVMAFQRPERGGQVNTFTGPAVKDRVGTLLGMGGWVAPPMEDRLAYWTPKKLKHRKPAKNYAGLPVPAVQRAMPVQADRTDLAPPGMRGDFPPLWMELSDPTLEDVYWMVWQMLAGKQFIGMRAGAGFGIDRKDEEVTRNLALNPFKSPSPEAVYHSSN